MQDKGGNHVVVVVVVVYLFVCFCFFGRTCRFVVDFLTGLICYDLL